ncbi:MAG: CGNR zinc finger domain-containing protein [Oceanicaulis sp.]
MERVWSDVGGAPILDFVNTAGGAGEARDAERLTGHAAVLDWGVWAGLLSRNEAVAGAGFSRTRLLARREALHAVLCAHAAGAPAPEAAVDVVSGWIVEARGRALLKRSKAGYVWRADGAAGGLLLSDRLALEAERLLTGGDMARLRRCERCSWLFLSGGRGRPRRWCSMATCGNREKAARHYARKTSAPSPRTPD